MLLRSEPGIADTTMSNESAVDQLNLFDLEIDSVTCAELPKDFFPEDWKDNVRMDVLFAPFRPRDLNPLNFDNKMKFWKQLIQKYCDQKGSAAISLAELRTAFKRANKRPYALEAVLDEMRLKAELQPIQEYAKPPQHTWRGWAKEHLTRAMVWPVLAVKAKLWQPGDEQKNESQYVVLDAVKVSSCGDEIIYFKINFFFDISQRQAEKLQRNCSVNVVLVVDGLMRNLQESGLSIEGAELALHQLWRDRKAVLQPHRMNGQDVQLVKIGSPSAGSTTVVIISEKEINAYDLNESVKRQRIICEKLETDIVEADAAVRKHVTKNKQVAKSHLKRKHALEQKLGNLSFNFC